MTFRRKLGAGLWLVGLAWLAALPHTVSAGLLISEFLAENDGGLRDADGDTPDWIEIQNDSAFPATLTGWHLTDDPANLMKWTFPATNLAPGSFLIVFASGKDRAMAGSELHANFQIESSGGYLALVAPDGPSVSQAVNYPAQRANVSFGPRRAVNSTTLSSNAPARVFVPRDGALGQSWTARGFDDSAWFASNTPVGFNASGTVTTLLALDFNRRGVDPALITQPGFTSFVINSNLSTTAIQTQATTRVFGGLSVTVSNTAPFGYNDVLRPTPTNNGAFAESLLLRDFLFSQDRTGTGGLDVTIEGLTANQLHRLTVWSFDVGSITNRASDWSANGVPITNNYAFNGQNIPVSNERYQFTFDASSDSAGRIWIAARRNPASVGPTGAPEFGVFLNALRLAVVNPPPEPTGLGALMIHSNATAYLRVPFTVSDPAQVSALRLRMGYNDGFVAHLNGQAITSRNAPASPAWNSTATALRTTTTPEDIFVIPPPGLLVVGANVLAIQGLNLNASDLTFSIAPELIAEQITELSGRFFKPPTPGTANGAGFDGLVADTKFSVNRGFYDAPFSLSITCATAGVEIRYTTNGSPPSTTSGFVFTAPITIDRHSFIRAAAFRNGWVPSDIDTHSYIFLRDVAQQSNNIPGYPTIWNVESYPADYAMDSNIVNHAVYGPALSNSLRSIPTLAIVSEHNGLWSASTGIYPNSTSTGTNWERAASLELIDGSGATEFAVNARIEMHGNASRFNVRTPKHSMHVVFNGDYGPTKLRYDWFGGGVDVHNKIVFRSCGFVDGWAGRYADNALYTSAETGEQFRGLRYRPENTCYLRDVWTKDSFRDMGWISSRSQYVHLYINGLYWGLYEPSEAPTATCFSEHLGGPEGAWDVLVGEDGGGPPVIVDGSVADWNNVLTLANAGITTEAAYAAITNRIEIDNLIDYMMVHIVAESEDWPHHNWYVAHRRATNGVPGTKFICSVWDQELTLDRLVRRNRINAGNGTGPAGEMFSPGRVYSQLRTWPEFRRQFGDRVHKHLFNTGALTPSNNVTRLLGPAAIIRDALIGESARWGDARKTGVPAGQIGTGQTFTPDEWWQPEIDKLATNFFQKLTADNVARFRAGQLYPAIAAPVFGQFGGTVPAGFGLAITHTNAAGVIYFTTDGTDPRTYGTGAVAPGAQAYSAPVVLNSPTVARARVLNGGQWSALTEAAFYPPQDLSRLALTEIMYNPPAMGLIDGDEFEFLELKNAGTNTLNLSGLTFVGINFTFTNGTLLGPGQFLVLTANGTSFAAKYPDVTVRGVYSGQLANGGESLALVHPLGATVFSVTFNDDVPWPLTPDNYDHSLVPKNPGLTQAPDHGADWRASTNPGGSPGTDDPTSAIPPIVINEILTASVPPAVDRIELFNPTAAAVDIDGWFLSDDAGVPMKFRVPNGTMISAGGFVVFTETQFNATPGTNGSFSLSSRGESVYLFSGDANTNLTGYSHGFSFDAAPDGASFGRYVNSVGEEQFPEQLAPSFAAANQGPRAGPVVISEIHYHATPGGDEFIELENVTAAPIPLYDPAQPAATWRLNGLGFTFPTNITVPANGRLLLVATNPAAFRAKYNVAASVPILGPYSGELQGSGERLKLQRPAPPDTNGPAFITLDEVRYNDKAPWPPAADGSGASLQRLNAAAYGNDPINWTASAPTPGQSLDNADADGDGLPDSWEETNGTDRLVADAGADPDQDGATNLDEYLAGTDPQSAQSRLKVDAITSAPGLTTLQFLAVSNRTYSVLYKNSLDAPSWSKLGNVELRATNWTVVVQDTTLLLTNRFYRLVTPSWP